MSRFLFRKVVKEIFYASAISKNCETKDNLCVCVYVLQIFSPNNCQIIANIKNEAVILASLEYNEFTHRPVQPIIASSLPTAPFFRKIASN